MDRRSIRQTFAACALVVMTGMAVGSIAEGASGASIQARTGEPKQSRQGLKWVNGDILVTNPSIDHGRPSLAVAPTGELWLACERALGGVEAIEVYRSTDGGASWGILSGLSSGVSLHNSSLAYIDNGVGTRRVFVVYERHTDALVRSVNIFWFDPDDVPGTWDQRTICTIDMVSDREIYPRLVTDNEEFPDPYLYVTYAIPSDVAYPVFFSRSTNLGFTWSTPHDVTGSSQDTTWPTIPDIAFGKNRLFIAFVKPGWTGSGWADQIWVTRGTDFGGVWDTPVQLTYAPDDEFLPAIAAAHDVDTVVVAFARLFPAGDTDVRVVHSTNGGTSWSGEYSLPFTLDDEGNVDLAASRTYAGRFHAVFWRDHDVMYTSTDTATPAAWSPLVTVNQGSSATRYAFMTVAVDPTVPGAYGAVVAWTDTRAASYTVYFDSASRFDAGLVFADGFESGDTDLWSSSTP